MRPLVYKKKKRVKHGPVARHKMHITKGDTVRVMRGEDKGKEGRVLRVDRKHGRVVVEGTFSKGGTFTSERLMGRSLITQMSSGSPSPCRASGISSPTRRPQ